MSNRAGGAAVGLLLALGTATPSAAQTAPVLRSRLARLTVAWRAAQVAADRADSVRTFGPFDTIPVGPLTLSAGPAVAEKTRTAVRDAWPLLDSLYSGDTQPLLGAQWYVLPATQLRRAGARRPNMVVVSISEQASIQDVRTQIFVEAAQVYGQDPWLGAYYGVALHPALDRTSAYVELVTAPYRASRGCLVGAIGDCALAFGLEPGADPVMQWYDAADRRRIAVQIAETRSRDQSAASAATLGACEEGTDRACVALLRTVPMWTLPRPFTSSLRIDLLCVATGMGGSGAFARWMAGSGDTLHHPAAERLSRAAGVSRDSLLAAWRTAVLAARPRTVATPPRAAWAAVFWGALFAVLALRSSRWR